MKPHGSADHTVLTICYIKIDIFVVGVIARRGLSYMSRLRCEEPNESQIVLVVARLVMFIHNRYIPRSKVKIQSMRTGPKENQERARARTKTKHERKYYGGR